MIQLSIVVLSYNTKTLTLNCIKSIANRYGSEINKGELEIIVVDNASTDGSQSAILNIKNKISNMQLIENKANVGFARGCNIGAGNAEGKYILFLNSDTQILDKGFLNMLDFLESHPEVAILGGKLHNTDGSVQLSAGKFYTLFNLVVMLLGMERFGMLRSSPDKIKQVDWVSGACMMLNKEIFKKLGRFDEHFFMYMEDMELCFRYKKLGLLTYFYPNIRVMHKGLGSSNRAFAVLHIYKGILYFYKKHKSFWQYLLVRIALGLKAVLLALVGIFSHNRYLKNTYKQAIRISI